MFVTFFLLLFVGIKSQHGFASSLSSSIISTPSYSEEALVNGGKVTSLAETASSSVLSSKDILPQTSATNTAGSVTGMNSVSPTAQIFRTTSTRLCNNYVEFCNRSYGNITEVCAHNSPFDIANDIASNQMYNVVTQLNDGIRMLQGQTHMLNGSLHFCHTSCDLLDGGTVEAYFSNVSAWLQYHPYEVVTILIVNGDNSSVTDYVNPIQSSGLGHYVYTPPKTPMGLMDWPTLGALIDSNTRVIVFMDYGANQKEVPYILDEFSQLWETVFSPTNASFPCAVQRPSSLSSEQAENMLYLANHNLNVPLDPSNPGILIPDLASINQTNGVSGFSSLGLAAENCIAMWNRPPNFLLVDYYNDGTPSSGSVFEVAASINGVSYTQPCCGLNTETSSTAPSSTSTMPVASSVSTMATSDASKLTLNKLVLCVICLGLVWVGTS